MNYFKAAEQVLGSVPTLKRALENLRNREQRLIEQGKPREPGAIDYSKPFTDSHFVSDTLNELLELSECSRNIAETERTLAEVESIIEQLSNEHKKVVVLWYIEKRSKEAIAEALGTSVSTREGISFSSYMNQGLDPKFIGAVSVAEEGVISAPLAGTIGVYVYKVTSHDTGASFTEDDVKNRAAQMAYYESQSLLPVMMQDADVEDNRARFF